MAGWVEVEAAAKPRKVGLAIVSLSAQHRSSVTHVV